MSKAFTKESSGEDLELDLESQEESGSPDPLAGRKNYITPGGAEKLRTELKHLLNEERPELVKVIQWAASNGDRSENADYIYGKRRLREMDRRIRFLSKRLEIAEIIDPEQQKSEKVLFGATVTIQDENGSNRRFIIVGVDETNVKEGRISWVSPVGKALLQAQVGDTVTIHTPKGEEDWEIIQIEYRAIPS
ncbi:transcription elongation factor GreB [bacterium]|nr:transcription elongation factor GreB [bacterium]NBX83839.1 transcription elongation factor GreB [bacterium]